MLSDVVRMSSGPYSQDAAWGARSIPAQARVHRSLGTVGALLMDVASPWPATVITVDSSDECADTCWDSDDDAGVRDDISAECSPKAFVDAEMYPGGGTDAAHPRPDVGASVSRRSRWKIGVLRLPNDHVAGPPAQGPARTRKTSASKPSARKSKQPRPRRSPKWGACLRCGRAMRLCFGRGDLARPFLGCPAYRHAGDAFCDYTTRVPDTLQHLLPDRVVIRRRVF